MVSTVPVRSVSGPVPAETFPGKYNAEIFLASCSGLYYQGFMEVELLKVQRG